ncbi:MAG: glutamate synthase subunit beta [Alphaproteobacteria bacterium]
MTDPKGFLQIQRRLVPYRPVEDRVRDYAFVQQTAEVDQVREQARRCMGCGVPFCHTGCPLGNLIPEWNDLVERDHWREAIDRLHATNNFPEFTGAVCPAPCEEACVLALDQEPVTIKQVELAIIERAFDEGWVRPEPADARTGRRVAVIGSGPAGLACAQQLARAGHAVTVFERDDRIGGLLRYGIPDFKMEKHLIDRRVRQMEAEGVEFRTGVEVGATISVKSLLEGYDAVAMTGGAEVPRDLQVPGRELSGMHFAMDFLSQQNRRVAGDDEARAAPRGTISARGRHVVVIGGGDTGSDCVGTSNRHGAASVTQLEVMPQPPEKEDKALTWPDWPLKMRTSSSHEEGCERDFAVLTKRALGEGGKLRALECVRVEWRKGADGRMAMQEVAGSAFDLVGRHRKDELLPVLEALLDLLVGTVLSRDL